MQIRKCGKCGGLIEEETVLSCNDCGAVGWTDGYFIAPMWPDLPELVKCPHCKAFLWIKGQELLGEQEGPKSVLDKRLRARQGEIKGMADQIRGKRAGFAENPDFLCAESYIRLNKSDYFKIIGQGGLNNERLRYVRVRTWHCGNHARRDCVQDRSLFRRRKGWSPAGLSAREKSNLEALLPLLENGKDEDRVLKAEACRELGRFGDALRLLDGPIEEDFVRVADIIRELAIRQDAVVKEIIRSDG